MPRPMVWRSMSALAGSWALQGFELFPRKAREAWMMLEAAERGVRRLRRDNPLREEHLESIAHAKAVTRVPRPAFR